MPLLFLFILVPIIEITLFIQIGEQIGLLWTIATVIVTAVIGTHLVRSQGLKALASAQNSLNEQRLPLEEVFTGLCLLVAGALLLTPGFLTDAIGFTLLAPPFRKYVGPKILAYLKSRGTVQFQAGMGGQFHQAGPGFNPGGPRRGPQGEDIIEGDYEIVGDDPVSSPNSASDQKPPHQIDINPGKTGPKD